MNPSKSSSKAERKTIEKNRRSNMKNLYSQLNSVVHGSSSGGSMPLPEQIDEATNYIKQLQLNVEELKQKRDNLRGSKKACSGSKSKNRREFSYTPVQIEVNENEGTLEVTLVTGLECQFVFNEIIRILHEENAEVLNASYSVVEQTAFHTIHAQIGDDASSYAAARISERLKQFAL